MQPNKDSKSPAFGTLLIRRKTNEQPSDLELQLRSVSQRIRIVEKLAGGAHLMVPGSPSVAIRIYTSEMIRELEENSLNSNDLMSEEDDGLTFFRDCFENSIVFFVLQSGEQQRDQLGRRDSFVSVAQRSLLSRRNTMEENNTLKQPATRTFIVANTTQVIQAIDSVLHSLSPEKRERKRQYFEQISSQHYLPNRDSCSNPTNESVSNYVCNTFHAWADRFEMPEGDSSVLLSIMGSLGTIVTADEDVLDEVPIRSATKKIISTFFGASGECLATGCNFDGCSPSNSIDENEGLKLKTTKNIIQLDTNAPQMMNQRSEINLNNDSTECNTLTDQHQYLQTQLRSNSVFSPHPNQFNASDVEFTPLWPSYSSNYQDPLIGGRIYKRIIPDYLSPHAGDGHCYQPSFEIDSQQPAFSEGSYGRYTSFGDVQNLVSPLKSCDGCHKYSHNTDCTYRSQKRHHGGRYECHQSKKRYPQSFY